MEVTPLQDWTVIFKLIIIYYLPYMINEIQHFSSLHVYSILTHFPPYMFIKPYTFIRQVRVGGMTVPVYLKAFSDGFKKVKYPIRIYSINNMLCKKVYYN